MTTLQSKQFCRLSFVLFGALPTLAVLWFVFSRGDSGEWEIQLESATGFDCAIGKASNASLNQATLHDIRWSDTWWGEFARMEQLQVAYEPTQAAVIANRAVVRRDVAPRMLNQLIERYVFDDSLKIEKSQLLIHQLTLLDELDESNSAWQSYEDIQASVESMPRGAAATIWFRQAGDDASERVEINLSAEHNSSGDYTVVWQLDTGSADVPCGLALPWLPWLTMLGDDATFHGRIVVHRHGDEFSLQLNGNFQNVDLFQLVSQNFHHNLYGNAEIRIERLILSHGRIEEAMGSIHSSEGQISKSLVDGIVSHLGAEQVGEPQSWPIRYRDLTIHFHTDGRTLEVLGDRESRLLMRDERDEVRIAEGFQTTVPALSLIRALVPESEYKVPLTEETATLISRFPIPTAKLPVREGGRLRLEEQ